MRHGGPFAFVLAVAFALTLTWLHNLWRHQQVLNERLDTSKVDYYLSDFSLFATDAEGHTRFTLKGDHFVHQRKTRISDIYKPAITVHDKNDILSITANKAEQNTAGDISLQGKVDIDKPESVDFDGFTLKTADIVYSPKKKDVDTNADIMLTTTNGAKIQGTGLHYDIASEETRIKSNVHAEYTPE